MHVQREQSGVGMAFVSSLILRVRSLRRRSRLPRSVRIHNAFHITIGEGCTFGQYVVLRGGEGQGCVLSIGDRVLIRDYAYISAGYNTVVIEPNAGIGHGVWIGGTAPITIGANSMVGMYTVVISSNHDYSRTTVPFYTGQECGARISIGRNVWIGANCTILPGVVVGDNAVVAAGSVVVEKVEPYTMVAGNPAGFVKTIS